VLFVEMILRPVVWMIAAPKVIRKKQQIPDGPVLIIANHVTSYDGALILHALPPPLRRHLAAAMSGEMLLDYRRRRNQGNWFLNQLAPVAYWLLTALFNVFPLPRMRGFRRSFAHAGEAMDRGYSVLVFPEGHRSRTGVMQPFRPGIGLLARESNVAILPVALLGLGAGGARWVRSRRIEVRIGEPVRMGDETPAAFTAKLEAAMHKLMASQR